MNIAVLLRGKQNFSKKTSALFERLVCERFPHIDFKLFIHTWLSATSYSQSMGRGRILFEHTSNEIEYRKPNTVGY